MLNDLLLLIKIKEGDIKSFETVFRHYYSPLLYFSAGITGRGDIAEEIIQDLFYVLWRDREKIQITRTLKGYLYSAVRNRSLLYCRRRKLDENYVSGLETDRTESDAQESMEYRELEEIITKTMNKMPERRMKIFRMHRFESRKYEEIAQMLSLSVKTIEAEMTKALRALRKEVELHTSIQ